MSQKLPLRAFEWVQELLQFNNDFIKSYDEVSNIGNFFWNWYSKSRRMTWPS